MTEEEIVKEYIKCKESPYYFATKYIGILKEDGEFIHFTTSLSEKEFNELFTKNIK